MPAVKYDLAVEQGATFSFSMTWKDSSGTPIDLTGATAHMQMRSGPANIATTTLLDLHDGDGITLGGTAGTILIQITAAQTETLKVSRAMYDLYVTIGTDTYRVMEGAVTVDPTVTV